jgi:hypothetical protein
VSLVRPSLEYASAVWDSYQQNDIHRLEMVQRRAARYVTNRYHTPHRLVAWLNIYNGLPYRNEENIVDYWWCISWRKTSYELMHQASLYQMNNPPETTMSRHYAFHHARPQYGRSRSILDRAMNGTPCLTVLSLPWVLYHSRLSSVIKLKWHCFYLHCI